MKRLASFKPAAYAAAGLALLLAGCFQDKVAGGSSEVDNPIVVAFVDSLGVSVTASGSLSIFLAGQNPALDPYPLLTKQLDNVSSIELSARDFTQGLDTSRSYNLLLIGEDDSVGALLQNLSYHPENGRYTFDSATVIQVKVPVVPLVRYEASLNVSSDTGLVRVFIPGTPFQSVVVDSSFVLDGVPSGTFDLHVLSGDGSERPLKTAPENPAPGNHHEIDTTSPPIVRPPPPPPTQALVVFAGADVSLSAPSGGNGATSYFFSGTVLGVGSDDPRLAVKWRQIGQGPGGAKATFESPTSLNTRVNFPRGGTYQLALSAVLGTGTTEQRVEDTILVGIQQPIEQTRFISPTAAETVYLWSPYKVTWDGNKKDSLMLEISSGGGTSWASITFMPLESHPGLNSFDWFPGYPWGDTASNVRLRLRGIHDSTIVATSGAFQLRYRPYPSYMKTRTEEPEEAQGSATDLSTRSWYDFEDDRESGRDGKKEGERALKRDFRGGTSRNSDGVGPQPSPNFRRLR